MIRNFAGFLGLLALLAATVVGMLVVAGFIAPGAPERGPQFINARGTEKEVEKQTIDRTIEVGDVSWTIHEAKLTNKISTYTFPPTTRTGAFIEITFTAENVSDIPITLEGESVVLVGPEGQEDPANADTNAKFVDPELNILFNEHGLIAPDDSKEGKVNFDLDVPFGIESLEEVSGFKVRFKGTDPTVVNEEEIDLEF